MISEPQYKVLVSLLAIKLPAGVDGTIAAVYVGQEAAARMPTASRLEPLAKWMIDEVLRQPTPEGFIYVVRVADDQQGGIASLVDLADRLSADPTLWRPLGGARLDWTLDADPLAVADGRPFLDRQGFRQLLPRLGAADTPSCVLVTGEPMAGKSYLSDFCHAFAMCRSDLKIAYVRAPANATYSESARNLATTLAIRLDIPLDDENPMVHPERERDAEILATWLVQNATSRTLPSLVILDEFGRPGVKEVYHRFVTVLAKEVQAPEIAKRLRLVLIDYDRDRLSTSGITPAHYILEAIEAAQISDWFRKQYPGKPEIRYENVGNVIAAKMLARPQSERMEYLNNAVRQAALKSFESA